MSGAYDCKRQASSALATRTPFATRARVPHAHNCSLREHARCIRARPRCVHRVAYVLLASRA
jgi:hypothetical protein